MENYSIKDLEKLSGIKAHTIRVWERRFRILQQHRTETNRRRYGDSELRRIINIAILNRNGYKISKIAQFTSKEIEEKAAFLSKLPSQPDTQVDSLIVAMIEKNEKEINELLIRNSINMGVEETFTDLVFPFLQRIGIMWHTGLQKLVQNILSQIFSARELSLQRMLYPPN